MQRASLNLLRTYLDMVLSKCDQQASTSDPTAVTAINHLGHMDPSKLPVKLLDDAVAFAFKCHQFTGGFDAACAQAMERLTPLWQACRQ